LGFTGFDPSGKRVSVQGSGMGMPSLSIYVNELINSYDVKRIIRIGSAGSLEKELPCRSLVLAMGGCSDSAMNHRRFDRMSFAPIADWKLLLKAHEVAEQLGIKVKVGNVFATDTFYGESVPACAWRIFAEYGVCAVEMETAELYTLAAKKGIQALTILTISNNVATNEKTSLEWEIKPENNELSSLERETGFDDMVKIALEL
jgi:purine-nucleoside phosphorylase